MRAVLFASIIAIACASLHAHAAAPGTLFGTYSPVTQAAVFNEMNYWFQFGGYGNGSTASLRVVNVPFAPPNKQTGVCQGIAEIRRTWGWNSAVPYVTWMPYAYGALNWQSPTPNELIVNGAYDDYLDAFLTQLSTQYVYQEALPKRLYLNFGPQANGNWYPWSPSCPQCANNGQHIDQTPQSYVAMWQYVMKKVRAPKYNLTSDVLQTVFDAATFSPGGAVSSFAPPGDLADWFSMTGMNWGNALPGNSWTSPNALFGATVQALREINASKPIGISSAASGSQPNGMSGKTEWINNLCAFIHTEDIRLMTYYNYDMNTDLAVFGGETGPANFTSPVSTHQYREYPAFVECMQLPRFVGSDASFAQLIPDWAFFGQEGTQSGTTTTF